MRFVYLLIFVFLVACTTTSPIPTKEINGLVDDLMQMSKDLNIQEQVDPKPKTTQFLTYGEKFIYLLLPQGIPDFTNTVLKGYASASQNVGIIIFVFAGERYYLYVCKFKAAVIGLAFQDKFWEYEDMNPMPVSEDAFLYIIDLAEVYCGENGEI